MHKNARAHTHIHTHMHPPPCLWTAAASQAPLPRPAAQGTHGAHAEHATPSRLSMSTYVCVYINVRSTQVCLRACVYACVLVSVCVSLCAFVCARVRVLNHCAYSSRNARCTRCARDSFKAFCEYIRIYVRKCAYKRVCMRACL